MPTIRKVNSTTKRNGIPLPNVESEFIECEKYFELIVSRRKLIRVDDRAAGINGLHDTETGQKFCIEVEKLLRF